MKDIVVIGAGTLGAIVVGLLASMRVPHRHFGGEGDDERFLDQVRIGS